MTRARQAALLLRPLLRIVSLLPLVAAAALGVGALHLGGQVVIELRLAAIGLCVAAGFTLDDPAAETLAASPTPLLYRRLLRVALLLPLVAALWTLLLWQGRVDLGTTITLELTAMLALTLAAAAVASRKVAEGRGGLAAGPTLMIVLGATALLLPSRLTLFASGPQDPRWTQSHERWTLLLLAAALALLLASRDPGRRPLIPRRRRSPRILPRQLDGDPPRSRRFGKTVSSRARPNTNCEN